MSEFPNPNIYPSIVHEYREKQEDKSHYMSLRSPFVVAVFVVLMKISKAQVERNKLGVTETRNASPLPNNTHILPLPPTSGRLTRRNRISHIKHRRPRSKLQIRPHTRTRTGDSNGKITLALIPPPRRRLTTPRRWSTRQRRRTPLALPPPYTPLNNRPIHLLVKRYALESHTRDLQRSRCV